MTNRGTEATAILKIRGLGDPGQALRLRRATDKPNGILRVDINYILDTITVTYDADKLSIAQVKRRINTA